MLSFFFQAEDGIRDLTVTGVQTCALPISIVPPAYAPLRTGGPNRSWTLRSSKRAPTRSALETSTDTLGRCPQLRSEEHTSELQSQSNLVCRLLLEKKKTDYEPTSSAHVTV